MTKLVYIVNRIDGPGGLERVLSIKASILAEQYDYDVHVITLNQNTNELFYDFSSKITYHDIQAKGNSLLRGYRYISGIRKKIKELQPQIIAVCDDGFKGFFVPLFIGKPCPMLYERHVSINATLPEKTSFLSRMITQIKSGLMLYGAKMYDHFVVLTQGNLNEWNLKNLKVIPNPLSFYPSKQSTLQNKKVIAVGKQSFQKGYDRLLKSWQFVSKKHPDWILDIYGTINKSEGLEKLANDLKISKTVRFHSPVKNIGKKYQEASIYTMSSRYEGFGMVLTEAMAYGVPCISFDCPYGPSDIITHDVDGYLVPNGNTELFGNYIVDLIENNQKRVEMGKKAHQNVKKYLPETIVAQWNELFISMNQVIKQS